MKNDGPVDFLPFGNRDRLKLLASNRTQKSRCHLPPLWPRNNPDQYRVTIRSVSDCRSPACGKKKPPSLQAVENLCASGQCREKACAQHVSHAVAEILRAGGNQNDDDDGKYNSSAGE